MRIGTRITTVVSSTRIADASVRRPPSATARRFWAGPKSSATHAATEKTRMKGLKTQNASSRISASASSSGVGEVAASVVPAWSLSEILLRSAAQPRLTPSGSSFRSSSPGRRGKCRASSSATRVTAATIPSVKRDSRKSEAIPGRDLVPEARRDSARRSQGRPRRRTTGSRAPPGSGRRCARRSRSCRAARSPPPRRRRASGIGPSRHVDADLAARAGLGRLDRGHDARVVDRLQECLRFHARLLTSCSRLRRRRTNRRRPRSRPPAERAAAAAETSRRRPSEPPPQ